MPHVETPTPVRPPEGTEPPRVRFSRLPAESVGVGLARVLTEQANLGAWHMDCARLSDTHVHEARKTTKRMRAVLRMVRDDLQPGEYARLNVEIRDISRELSDVRSAVVQTRILASLVDEMPQLAAATASFSLTLLADAEKLRRALDAGKQQELSLRFAMVCSRVETLQLPDGEISSRGVSRTYRRGRMAMRNAYATPTIESFHMWRKRVKYLRHQMEVLERGSESGLSGLVSDLEEIGEELGMDHDLADLERTAQGVTTEVLSLPDARNLSSVITVKRAGLERRIEPLAMRVYADKPSAFAQKVLLRSV